MTTQWKLTLSFSRFNAKHTATFNDKSAAKHVAMKAIKEGIWVVKNNSHETYWGPESIAKIDIELVEEEPTQALTKTGTVFT